MVFDYNERSEEKGFIDKNKILIYITEEEIFELVFGFQPKEFDYVTSPFRDDNNPGCWFEYTLSGKLKFKDFGSQIYIKGKKMINIDCFDAVQIYYNLPNLYKTLEFINNKFIHKKNIKTIKIKKIKKKPLKKKVIIDIKTRPFNLKDKVFWEQYDITKQNLINDNIFAITNLSLKNTKKGDFNIKIHDICYAYTEFQNGRKKIYRPYQKGRYKFITNCTKDDIGGIKNLSEYGNKLIISKSYKDYRVLKNQGLNTVWFQNEGMVPDEKLLIDLCKRFTYIIIFYDNDNVGIKESKRISEILNSYFPGKSRSMYLPPKLLIKNVKDPSDFYAKYGKELLIRFLKEKKLL